LCYHSTGIFCSIIMKFICSYVWKWF
jgi:hypothetical protein